MTTEPEHHKEQGYEGTGLGPEDHGADDHEGDPTKADHDRDDEDLDENR